MSVFNVYRIRAGKTGKVERDLLASVEADRYVRLGFSVVEFVNDIKNWRGKVIRSEQVATLEIDASHNHLIQNMNSVPQEGDPVDGQNA